MDYDKEFKTKGELVEYAESRGISTEGTRAEITERLVAQDEINAAAESDGSAQPLEVSDKPTDGPAEGVITTDRVKVTRSSTEQPQQEATGEPAEETDDGKVLVRMTKKASKHVYGPHTFTRSHPFALVDAELAQVMVEGRGFRRATAAEAEKYYG